MLSSISDTGNVTFSAVRDLENHIYNESSSTAKSFVAGGLGGAIGYRSNGVTLNYLRGLVPGRIYPAIISNTSSSIAQEMVSTKAGQAVPSSGEKLIGSGEK
jgi:hypothetical protein